MLSPGSLCRKSTNDQHDNYVQLFSNEDAHENHPSLEAQVPGSRTVDSDFRGIQPYIIIISSTNWRTTNLLQFFDFIHKKKIRS